MIETHTHPHNCLWCDILLNNKNTFSHVICLECKDKHTHKESLERSRIIYFEVDI